jgi:hypothetical protein
MRGPFCFWDKADYPAPIPANAYKMCGWIAFRDSVELTPGQQISLVEVRR